MPHKPIQKLLLTLALSLALNACAKNTNNPEQASSAVQKIETASPEAALALAKTSVATCADANDCPSAIALLVATENKTVFSCTATLVGANLALTNSHCIPPGLKTAPNADCSQKIRLIFPASSSAKHEEIFCSKVLSFSAMNVNTNRSLDYALIELQEGPARPPLTLDASGIADQQNFTIYKMDPLEQGAPASRLVRQNCKAVYNSMALPQFTSANAEVANTADCNIVPGNSGSPLVNTSGSISAIIQAKAPENAPLAFRPYLEDPHLASFAYASNVACMNLPSLLLKANALCSSSEDNGQPLSNLLNLQNLEKTKPQELAKEEMQKQKLLADWLSKNSQELFWQETTIAESNTRRVSTMTPLCFKSASGNLSYEDGLPTLTTQVVFDRYLQAQSSTSFALSHSATFFSWKNGIMSLEEDDNTTQSSILVCAQ